MRVCPLPSCPACVPAHTPHTGAREMYVLGVDRERFEPARAAPYAAA